VLREIEDEKLASRFVQNQVYQKITLPLTSSNNALQPQHREDEHAPPMEMQPTFSTPVIGYGTTSPAAGSPIHMDRIKGFGKVSVTLESNCYVRLILNNTIT